MLVAIIAGVLVHGFLHDWWRPLTPRQQIQLSQRNERLFQSLLPQPAKPRQKSRYSVNPLVEQPNGTVRSELVGTWTSPYAVFSEGYRGGTVTWTLKKDGTYVMMTADKWGNLHGTWTADRRTIYRGVNYGTFSRSIPSAYELSADGRTLDCGGNRIAAFVFTRKR